jgi:hypothetical protein
MKCEGEMEEDFPCCEGNQTKSQARSTRARIVCVRGEMFIKNPWEV